MATFKPGISLTLATALVFSILCGLGLWQVQRLVWKTELIASIEASRTATPQPFSSAVAAYQRVWFEGTLQEAQSVCIFGSNSTGDIGMFQLHPVKLKNDGVILVNMGWINNDKLCQNYRFEESSVRVTGVVRDTRKPETFTPTPDLEKRVWYISDLTSMAKVLPFAALAPVFIDAVSLNAEATPRQSLMRQTLTNNHLQYAFTWFSLSVVLLGVFLALGLKRGREAA